MSHGEDRKKSYEVRPAVHPIEVLALTFIEFVFVSASHRQVNPRAFIWEGFSLDDLISLVFLWFARHPFGAATLVYAASISGVLLYAYFEPRERM